MDWSEWGPVDVGAESAPVRPARGLGPRVRIAVECLHRRASREPAGSGRGAGYRGCRLETWHFVASRRTDDAGRPGLPLRSGSRIRIPLVGNAGLGDLRRGLQRRGFPDRRNADADDRIRRRGLDCPPRHRHRRVVEHLQQGSRRLAWQGPGRPSMTGRCRFVDRLAFSLASVLAMHALPGCMVYKFAAGDPGTDIRAVSPGENRDRLEALLGPPVRTWTTRSGIEYRVYRYDAGRPGSAADAIAFAVMDIGTMGAWEVMGYLAPPSDVSPDHAARFKKLAVAYDRDGRAVGVFLNVGDLDVLPDDGRSDVPAQRE